MTVHSIENKTSPSLGGEALWAEAFWPHIPGAIVMGSVDVVPVSEDVVQAAGSLPDTDQQTPLRVA